jgi:hypothetical protein
MAKKKPATKQKSGLPSLAEMLDRVEADPLTSDEVRRACKVVREVWAERGPEIEREAAIERAEARRLKRAKARRRNAR